MNNVDSFNTFQRICEIEQFLSHHLLEGISDPYIYNQLWEKRMAAHEELRFYRSGGTIKQWNNLHEKK